MEIQFKVHIELFEERKELGSQWSKRFNSKEVGFEGEEKELGFRRDPNSVENNWLKRNFQSDKTEVTIIRIGQISEQHIFKNSEDNKIKERRAVSGRLIAKKDDISVEAVSLRIKQVVNYIKDKRVLWNGLWRSVVEKCGSIAFKSKGI